MDIIRIMKTNAWLMAVYAAVRVAVMLRSVWGVGYALTFLAAAGVLALVRYLTGNMWKKRGMLSLSFMFSLIVTDAAAVLISLLSLLFFGHGLFFGGIPYVLWISGVIGLFACGILLVYGVINETKVRATEYSFFSDKITEDCTVCVLSDTHFGTVQKKETLNKHIDLINGYTPDIVLLAGDITEERTSKEDMLELFGYLSRLRSRYGTYFVDGNHDRQQRLTAEERSYTDREFDDAMKNAGIVCLNDSSLMLPQHVTVIGRNDHAEKSRLGLDELLENTDPSSFRLIVEHQPEEYDDYAAAGIDMQVTGHYHGAQNWPLNILYALAGIKYNGLYRIGNMKLLVNTGFAGSQYAVRTHSKCEYLIIHLKKRWSENDIL